MLEYVTFRDIKLQKPEIHHQVFYSQQVRVNSSITSKYPYFILPKAREPSKTRYLESCSPSVPSITQLIVSEYSWFLIVNTIFVMVSARVPPVLFSKLGQLGLRLHYGTS